MPKLIGRDRELADSLAGLRRGDAVVLTGEAGAGKTMLLREGARRCRRSLGWDVVEVRPAEATRDLPLWPLHPLIPAGGVTDRAELVPTLKAVSGAADRRTLVAVDDAQHLDPASIVVLRELCEDPAFTVIAAVRDGAPRSSSLETLWSAGPSVEIGLAPFDVDTTADLAAVILGGPITAELGRWLASTARGNPLLVRELLLDAQDNGVLDASGGTWSLEPSDDTPVGPRSRRYIRRRIGRLDDAARRLLDLVTIAGSLNVGWLSPDQARSSVELVERRLLVESVDHDGTRTVKVDHPLVGDVVLETMDASHRWTATWELVNMSTTTGPEPGEASRLASWAAAIGHPLDPDLWVAAAREAIAGFDLDHALVWARIALDGDRAHHGAHRAVGEILRLRGDLSGAAVALEAAAATATAEDDIVATALDRAALVGFQRGEPAEAMAILRTAVDRVGDPLRAMSLRSEAAVFGTLLGRFDDVMLLADIDPSARGAADPITRWTLGLNELYALTMLGRVAHLDDRFTAMFASDETVVNERPHEMDLLLGVRGATRIQTGELERGVTELVGALESRRADGRYRGIATAVLTLLLDLLEDPTAAEVADESLAQHAWMDPFGSEPIAVAVATLVAAHEGRTGDAVAHLDAFDHAARSDDPWTAIWIGRARARVAFDTGDPEAAVSACLRAGEAGFSTGHHAYAAVTLHDGVRYGGAADIVELLTEAVAETRGGGFLELLVRHTAAVATGDLVEIAQCAERFASAGATGFAAEAHAQRARRLADADPEGARRADVRARTTSRRGMQVGASVPDAVSDRELDVARLAARGRTSAQIASEVYLSRRTVDNHLHAVYRKLGIDGRGGLAALLPDHRTATAYPAPPR